MATSGLKELSCGTALVKYHERDFYIVKKANASNIQKSGFVIEHKIISFIKP